MKLMCAACWAVLLVILGCGSGEHAVSGETDGLPRLDSAEKTVVVWLDDERITKMEFALIPSGTCTMGSEVHEDERPVHQVKIENSFWLGTTEVTQAQWQTLMKDNPSKVQGPNLPVSDVSWKDCQRFLLRLNERLKDKVARLPNEAEWEFACRAGSSSKWSSGDLEDALAEYAWFEPNSAGHAHEVAERKPNSWGLFDMHGNLWEWCEDYYGPYLGRDAAPGEPAAARFRCVRGGSWADKSKNCRSALRYQASPDDKDEFIGFRVLLR